MYNRDMTQQKPNIYKKTSGCMSDGSKMKPLFLPLKTLQKRIVFETGTPFFFHFEIAGCVILKISATSFCVPIFSIAIAIFFNTDFFTDSPRDKIIWSSIYYPWLYCQAGF